ncbi:dTDP-4-dehydrorhamnose 3,5-epimerase [Aureitalea marina]|uniref:dTDP-4-dehydrorhamnose 3,5-epimerase n=1 Tax=Aureitalea marina TaxID=930804 RepID=A0A2S7KTV6_9FLAO|nr:dTDP-4-dehydrorhamnose 3,5-epimerase [Aureitalea marina]PQB06065.1 dTDP-4-dehydrorhamnose 3,5-epimerase [Aureitalea marina]
MERIETPLAGSFIIRPRVFEDERGIFCETFKDDKFKEFSGIDRPFVQDNQSASTYGVLRGLHFQRGEMSQSKLVRAVVGEVLDVIVDIRRDSPTFGQSFSVRLSDKNHLQLYVPRGFAHGFVTLSPRSVFAYKCDNYYDKSSEGGIIYNDPELALDWELDASELIISEKDLLLPKFQDASL